MRTALYTLITALCITFSGTAVAAEDGKAVFEDVCTSCHTGGFKGWITGAPDIDDAEEWAEALEKSLAELTEGTINGVGDMPARGKCKECSDEQLGAATEHLVKLLTQ